MPLMAFSWARSLSVKSSAGSRVFRDLLEAFAMGYSAGLALVLVAALARFRERG